MIGIFTADQGWVLLGHLLCFFILQCFIHEYTLNNTIKYDKSWCSLPVVTPVKYEQDLGELTSNDVL